MGDKGMRLAHWARIQPEVLAVQSIWGDRTFGELNARSNRLARALRARGLHGGDGYPGGTRLLGIHQGAGLVGISPPLR